MTREDANEAHAEFSTFATYIDIPNSTLKCNTLGDDAAWLLNIPRNLRTTDSSHEILKVAILDMRIFSKVKITL